MYHGDMVECIGSVVWLLSLEEADVVIRAKGGIKGRNPVREQLDKSKYNMMGQFYLNRAGKCFYLGFAA